MLNRLGPHHRSALTLRYVDDLPVPECAAALGRTVHATEALLVRARATFRNIYHDVEYDAECALPGGTDRPKDPPNDRPEGGWRA